MVQEMTPQDVDHLHTISRFDSEGVAERYAQKKHDQGWRNRRELALIDKAMSRLAPGSAVLDLPCGTGRLAIHMALAGYRVTAADASPNMVRVAREITREKGIETIDLSVQDVLDTKFSEDSFDVVVCNRLLHHYRSPELRTSVLRELKRISRGTVIAFYFLRTPISLLTWDLRNRIKGKNPQDRIPISRAQMEREALDAGLAVKRILWVKPGLSPQCYVVLEPLGSSLTA